MTSPAAAHPSSRRKRTRDAVPETAAQSSVQDAEPDSIALFLALHSPQPKVVRTGSLLSVSSSPPPPSPWSSLPPELLTSVCLFLSSWRDLLRLCRAHRCFDAVIRSEAAGNHCWQSVQAVKLRISFGTVSVNDRRIKLLPDADNAAPHAPAAASAAVVSSLSSPSLSAPQPTPAPPLPSPVRRVMESLRRHQQQLSRSSPRSRPAASQRSRDTLDAARHLMGQQPADSDGFASAPHIPSGTGPALCFLRSLRFVPRLRYCGELSLAFAAALSWSRQLRCLALDILDTQQHAMTAGVLNASLRSLPALRSLSLGRVLLFGVAFDTLCSLPLLHLELQADGAQLYHLLSALPGSPLSQSLRSLRLDCNSVQCLDVLPLLLHCDLCLPSSEHRTSRPPAALPPSPAGPLARLSSFASRMVPLYAYLIVTPYPLWLQSLRCLTLQLYEYPQGLLGDRTLQLLSRLSALEHLTQFTVTQAAGSRLGLADVLRVVLPSPLLWLPGLAHLDFLHLQCDRYMDDDWIAELLGAKEEDAKVEDEKAEAAAPGEAALADGGLRAGERQRGDVGCVGRLRCLGLRLNRSLVQEATLRRWRRERCVRLQHCAIRWIAPMTAAIESSCLQTAEERSDEEQLCRQRIDIAWQRQLALQL